jgi:hypothetical protein
VTWIPGVSTWCSPTETVGVVLVVGIRWSFAGLWWLREAESDDRELKWPLLATISGIVCMTAGPFVAIAWLPAEWERAPVKETGPNGGPPGTPDGQRVSPDRTAPRNRGV